MVDRKDIGSWLSGPDTSGISKYPGERLGLPESGPGSIARAGRRIAAICIDWGIALLISGGTNSNKTSLACGLLLLLVLFVPTQLPALPKTGATQSPA